MRSPLHEGFYPRLTNTLDIYGRALSADGLGSITPADVETCLHAPVIDEAGLLTLLSPAAEGYLEPMARRAREETERHFGRTVQMFTPLYLSNFCTNRCVYCGFHNQRDIPRRMLNLEEVEKEARSIAAGGLRKILALTGDAPSLTGANYLAECVAVLARFFSSVGVEVPSMTVEEYALLARHGCDSMTMFQETYHEELYARLHPAGPKRNFRFRLDAPERAIRGGMRAVNLGALLGLDDWRTDMFLTALHAAYLDQAWPGVEISVSFPRMRPTGGEATAFTPLSVSDRDLVQAMTAFRCFMPHAGITLSTRESAWLRDRLIPLGVTRVSAGVCTAVGGHAEDVPAGQNPQFDISDPRSVDEMAAALTAMGYQPVFSDWLLPGEGASPLAQGLHLSLGLDAGAAKRSFIRKWTMTGNTA